VSVPKPFGFGFRQFLRHRLLMARVCSRSSRVVLGRCIVSLVIWPFAMSFAFPDCRMNGLGGIVNRLVVRPTERVSQHSPCW
jgi:hypothetical protein